MNSSSTREINIDYGLVTLHLMTIRFVSFIALGIDVEEALRFEFVVIQCRLHRD